MDDMPVVNARELVAKVNSYEQLIKEAYIFPIRSVLVVDDEFPSLDGYISTALNQRAQKALGVENVELVRDILSFCRKKDRPWLVDIHDASEGGTDAEASIAKHLHHSDLMILDYHLEGQAGGGDASIKLMRALAQNDHFNLVIIYTKGYVDNDVRKVFYELLPALAYADYESLPRARFFELSGMIDAWLIENDIGMQALLEMLSYDQYLRERFKRAGKEVSGKIRKDISLLLRDRTQLAITPNELFSWLMQNQHESHAAEMSTVDFGRISFSFSADDAPNWIRTGSLFITVINKKCKPAVLEDELFNALLDSCPGPQQLLMAKMRAQIDGRGAVAEAQVLDDVYMQAGWLSELLDANARDKSELIDNSITKHWDALGDRLRAGMESFANRLLDEIGRCDKSTTLKKFFGSIASDKDAIISRINAYNNAKPVVSSHLMTGHILNFSADGSQRDLWLCMSPACDLVPGQKNGGLKNSIRVMPFTAVKLHLTSLSTALKKANENVFVFLRLDDDVVAFSFCPDGNVNASPVWERMYASNDGVFGHNGSLVVTRVSPAIKGDDVATSAMATSDFSVGVVAQLRYEYAINLLQRLGNNVSRIGLDYFSS